MKANRKAKAMQTQKPRTRGQQAHKPATARIRQTRRGVLVEPESNPFGVDTRFTKP